MTLYRCSDDDYCEMECTLFLDADMLQNPLVYKYVIYSPKVTKEDEYYEKLHPFITLPLTDPNRCLSLSAQERECASGGMNFMYVASCVRIQTTYPRGFKNSLYRYFEDCNVTHRLYPHWD